MADADKSIRERAGVALVSGSQVLLIHRWRGGNDYFVLPGGGVEAGEDVEQAAIRELREEVGVELDGGLQPLVAFSGFDSRNGIHQRFVAFAADAPARAIQMSKSAPEAATASSANRYELEWVELSSILSINLQPPELKDALLRLAR